MNLPFLTHHEGIGISQRQGLFLQSLDGQFAQCLIYLRISLAQDLDPLLILLLFCCSGIEMSHNLDGLLDILQFLFGCRIYGSAVPLYSVHGSLISFPSPKPVLRLASLRAEPVFCLASLPLSFLSKVRFLRFSFPFWMFQAFSSTSFRAV